MSNPMIRMLAAMLAVQLASAPVASATDGPIATSAQRAVQQAAENEPAMWKAMVEKLESGAFVAVRLKDGSRKLGTIIRAGDEAFAFKARTRIPVPAYDIAYGDIATIERQSPPLSPGKKVAIGVGIGAGVFTILGFLIAATLE